MTSMNIIKTHLLGFPLGNWLSLVLGILLSVAPAHAENLLYWSTISASTPRTEGSIHRGYQDGSGSRPGVNNALYNKETDPCGIAIDPVQGKIYWGEVANGGVRVANLDGSGEATTLFDDGKVCGIAIDPVERKIYWAKPENDLIRVANMDGSGSIRTLYTEPVGSTPTGLVIDPEHEKIYWTNRRANQVRSANLYGGDVAETLFSNEMGAVGIALDKASGNLYWANFFAGQIRVGSASGGVASTLFSGESPAGIAVDAALQRIYWGNFLTGEVRVGNLNGMLRPVTLIATHNRASFPVLLQKPIGLEPPLLSYTSAEETPHRKILKCSGGLFAADNIQAFLYRSPSQTIYTWFHNGRELSGSLKNTIAISAPGLYACAMTGMNVAGVANMLSQSVMIEPSVLAPEPAPIAAPQD